MAAGITMENTLVAQESDVLAVRWLEQVVPRIMRRLMDADNLDSPLLQLPLAQLRLAQALYPEPQEVHVMPGEAGTAMPQNGRADSDEGETMGSLSQRLGVRHSALTQAADRLIHNGLAERANDARDRRIVRLRLTQRGREWVGERRERRRARLAQLWGSLAAEERNAFLRAVVTLDAAASRLVSPSPAGAVSENGNGSTAAPPFIEEMLAHLTAEWAQTDVARCGGAGASGFLPDQDMTPKFAADKEGA